MRLFRPIRIVIDSQKPDARDALIQGHLDNGQWRSALRLVELQSRKGTTLRLAVNKCLIQMVSREARVNYEGLDNLQELIASKDNPILNIEILEAIDCSTPALMLAQCENLLSKMWEVGTNILSKDVQLLEGAFNSAWKNCDFVSGRKVSNLVLNLA